MAKKKTGGKSQPKQSGGFSPKGGAMNANGPMSRRPPRQPGR